MGSMTFPPQVQRWPILGPVMTALAFTLGAMAWVPWEKIYPSDTSLHEAIGYAPAWSHRFASIAGAHIDWTAFLVNVTIIWIICLTSALLLGLTARQR